MLQGSLPDLRWTPTLEQRDQRQRLLHRHKLVRMRAPGKNQLQHIAINLSALQDWCCNFILTAPSWNRQDDPYFTSVGLELRS